MSCPKWLLLTVGVCVTFWAGVIWAVTVAV